MFKIRVDDINTIDEKNPSPINYLVTDQAEVGAPAQASHRSDVSCAFNDIDNSMRRNRIPWNKL